jgi:hypothetical protein
MREANKPMALTYQSTPPAGAWQTVHRMIGWVGIVVGIVRILDGLLTLRLWGILFPSPYAASVGTYPWTFAITLGITGASSLILLGVFLLIGIFGMFTKSFSGIRLIKINECCAIIATVGYRAALQGQLIFTGTPIPLSLRIDQIVGNLTSLAMTCAFSLLVIVLFVAEDRASRAIG